MMNNKKILVLIALIAALAGLIGVVVCVLPGQTKPDKVVAKYVAAINAGNTEKMKAMDASTILKDALGSQLGGLGDQLDDLQQGLGSVLDKDESVSTDKIYTALEKSAFSITGALPEDFKEIKSVKVVGCVDGEPESYMGMTGLSVGVILEITYVDAEGEIQTLCEDETVGLILYKNRYYIGG